MGWMTSNRTQSQETSPRERYRSSGLSNKSWGGHKDLSILKSALCLFKDEVIKVLFLLNIIYIYIFFFF